MKLSACGIDLAKAVFQVHGVGPHGKPCLRQQLRRTEMLTFFVKLEPCLIGKEACGGAHYWTRKLSEMVSATPAPSRRSQRYTPEWFPLLL
jgi:transposase